MKVSGRRKFHGCFMIFEGVSRKFQENLQGVSKKFQVAWHSSQLPEQKEGLFKQVPRSRILRRVRRGVSRVEALVNINQETGKYLKI